MEWNGKTFGYRNISSTSQIAIAGGGGPDKGYKIIGMGPSGWRVRFLGWRGRRRIWVGLALNREFLGQKGGTDADVRSR